MQNNCNRQEIYGAAAHGPAAYGASAHGAAAHGPAAYRPEAHGSEMYRPAAPVFAGFWVRLAAYVADSVIVAVLLFIWRITMAAVFALISASPFDGNVLFEYTWEDILLYLMGAVYYVLSIWLAGTTLGKWLFRLRVVSADGTKLTFVDVLYRETVGKFLSGVIVCIGFIMAGFDREKRALHDILCDTRVIYGRKGK